MRPLRHFPDRTEHLDATDLKVSDLSSRHAKIRNAAAEIFSALPDDPLTRSSARMFGNSGETGSGPPLRCRGPRFWGGIPVPASRSEPAGEYRERPTAARDCSERGAHLPAKQWRPECAERAGPRRCARRHAGRRVRTLVPTTDGTDALQAHLTLTPRRIESHSFDAGFTLAALSRNGEAAVRRDSELAIYMLDGRTRARDSVLGVASAKIALADTGTPFRIENGFVVPLSATAPPTGSATETTLLFLLMGCAMRLYGKPPTLKRRPALWHQGKDKPSHHWTVQGMWDPLPIAFSANSAFLGFADGGRVSVAAVADGSMRDSCSPILLSSRSTP